jgi:hypothetical protein
MPRHIPEPPPVQKRTFPTKMSGLKTAVESTMGVTKGVDIARSLEGRHLFASWPLRKKIHVTGSTIPVMCP